MVKGVSRQVIVVHGAEDRLFEQAIFILKDGAQGVSDEALLRQAEQATRAPARGGRRGLAAYGLVWACGGALLTGAAWLLSVLL